MSKSVKIVFIKQSKESVEGTLFIRIIENRKIRKKSIGIKLDERTFQRFFLYDKQRFRNDNRFKEAEVYNDIISEKLKEVSLYDNELDLLPNKKKSFLDYWESKIKIITNHGTRNKNEVVLSKLTKFLNSIGKLDLIFSEITPSLLNDLQYYLRTAKDPKQLTENTASHYLKIIKSVISKASKDDYYTYLKNPFNTLELKSKSVKKPILTADEVQRLLNTKIDDAYLNLYRNMFLFQIFSNGMRVSDLLMLKIGNFKNGRLEYVMYKTGAPISMPININMALIISDLSKDLPKYTEFIKSEKIQIKDENNEIHEIGLTKLKRLILSLCNKTYKYNPMVNQYLSKLERSVESNMSRTINYKGYEIMKDDVKVKELIDAKEKLEENINTSFLNSLYYSIKRMQKMHKNEFLFPILRLKSFGDYTNYLSLEQYKNLKHATIVYNRHLKKVQDVCDIETNLSSHISRHTFTNLLLQMSGVNLYDVSLSLGHSNIKITEQYLRTGFNAEKLDVLNTGLADKFRKQN